MYSYLKVEFYHTVVKVQLKKFQIYVFGFIGFRTLYSRKNKRCEWIREVRVNLL